jgi:hypothetical protein
MRVTIWPRSRSAETICGRAGDRATGCFNRLNGANARLIAGDLLALGRTSLRELSFDARGGFEFFTTMSREANGRLLDRLTLAKQTCTELGAIAFS